jgi:hypothetical protein
MGDTTYKIGGKMGFTVQPKQYESMTVESTFEIVTEGSLTDEKLASMEEKINNILKKQSENRMREAFKHYTEKLQRIKTEAGY